MKYPKYLRSPGIERTIFQTQLLKLCRTWSEPLHRMAARTNTHDLGFIIQPALRKDWELTGDPRSLETVILAGHSLASRYDEKLGAVRSWDRLVNKNEKITDKEKNFLVIVDSMCSELNSSSCYTCVKSDIDRPRPPLLCRSSHFEPEADRHRNLPRPLRPPLHSQERLVGIPPRQHRSANGGYKSSTNAPRI